MWLVFDLLYSAILNHILFLFHKILHVTLFLRQTILHYIAASYSTYSIHIISFMIYSTILHYYISKYHVTLSVTLHYITLRYTCYIHVIFLYTFSRMPNRWHTHTQGTSPRESLATCAEILLLIFDILFWKNVSQEFRCVQRAIVALSLCFRPFIS
jgi:hypothetical protein